MTIAQVMFMISKKYHIVAERADILLMCENLSDEEYLELFYQKFNYRMWSRPVTVKDYRTEVEVG